MRTHLGLRKDQQAFKAFTLIELLVVISIIAILAALLLPSLAKAKGLSQETTCKSNLKNINLGLAFYYNAYNSTVPTTIGLSKNPSLRLPVQTGGTGA